MALSLLGTACAHAHSQHVLKKYIWRRSSSREECYGLLFVVLAKVSTFTNGFVLEGGITNCRVNQ